MKVNPLIMPSIRLVKDLVDYEVLEFSIGMSAGIIKQE